MAKDEEDGWIIKRSNHERIGGSHPLKFRIYSESNERSWKDIREGLYFRNIALTKKKEWIKNTRDH